MGMGWWNQDCHQYVDPPATHIAVTRLEAGPVPLCAFLAWQ